MNMNMTIEQKEYIRVIDKNALKASIRYFDKCCTEHKIMLNAGNASVIVAHDRLSPKYR